MSLQMQKERNEYKLWLDQFYQQRKTKGQMSALALALAELEQMLPLTKLDLPQFELLVKKFSIQGTEIVKKKALILSFNALGNFQDLDFDFELESKEFKDDNFSGITAPSQKLARSKTLNQLTILDGTYLVDSDYLKSVDT